MSALPRRAPSSAVESASEVSLECCIETRAWSTAMPPRPTTGTSSRAVRIAMLPRLEAPNRLSAPAAPDCFFMSAVDLRAAVCGKRQIVAADLLDVDLVEVFRRRVERFLQLDRPLEEADEQRLERVLDFDGE